MEEISSALFSGYIVLLSSSFPKIEYTLTVTFSLLRILILLPIAGLGYIDI